MTPLQWSTNPPKTPGRYWVRYITDSHGFVRTSIVCFADGLITLGDGHIISRIESYGGTKPEWAGPIPIPVGGELGQ